MESERDRERMLYQKLEEKRSNPECQSGGSVPRDQMVDRPRPYKAQKKVVKNDGRRLEGSLEKNVGKHDKPKTTPK